ncbi:MAG: tail fiber protein [Comamonadaceae bacterium]|nr:tail fiber protein [Comamonadaceae bacterium]
MQPSNSNPVMNGVVAPGTGVEGSRHDHVHPVDTSRAAASAATATGTSFTPTGGVAATDVQTAIAELDTEKAPLVSGVPAGAVMDFAMATAPTGWLICDGALVNRTTYAALFAAIGTTFGAGDGSTTFAVPNLAGRFRRMVGGNAAALGVAQAGGVLSTVTYSCKAGITHWLGSALVEHTMHLLVAA